MKLLLSKREKQKHYRRLRFKIYFFLALLVLSTTGILYALLNLSFLQIKRFETTEASDLEHLRGLVLQSSWARFLGYKNFLAWPAEVDGVKVEKNYSEGVLRLVGSKLEKFAIWCAGDDCFWMNRSGIAADPAPLTEGSSIFIIKNPDGGRLATGAPVAQERFLSNLVKIINGASQLPARIKEYIFSGRLQELSAIGLNGEKFIFSLRFEPSEKLFASLTEVISKNNLKNFEYIDLTVENRIYLKQR